MSITPKRVNAAIFDFDEVIVDLEKLHRGSERRLCARYGANLDSVEYNELSPPGRPIAEVVMELRRRFRLPGSDASLLVERQQLFLELLRETPLEPLPGVREAVNRLAQADLRLAVVSAGTADYLNTALDRLGLLSYFALVVAGEDVRYQKPHPEPYLQGTRRLGVEPSSCLAFEDSELGVRSAVSAGLICIGVQNPSARLRQDLSQAQFQLDSFRDGRLAAVLAELGIS